MIVGLTGGIGSGKTTVLSYFKEKEFVATYIADERAKWLMNNSIELKYKLIAIFGEDAYLDGKLNRKYISSIVFKDPTKLQQINGVVHPAVKEDFLLFVTKHKDKIVIYESAILFESNSYQNCDFIISVSSPLKDRIQRVMKRDQIEEKEVLSRIKNQYSDAKRNLQSHYVIHNISFNKTSNQVDKIYNILTKKRTFV